MIKLGDIGRLGPTMHIDETADLAGVTVQVSGASKGVNRLYARRLTACYRALPNVSTEWLEEAKSIVVLGAPIADRFKELETQRDDLLAQLVELVDIEGPQPGNVAWAGKVNAAIARVKGGT